MDWILDHLQLVIAIAAAIAYWLNNRRQAADEARSQSSDPAEEAERTRKVQEEIRRKIAERRAGQGTPPVSVPRTELPPVMRPARPAHMPIPPFGGPLRPDFERRPARPEPAPVPAESPVPSMSTAAVLQRQEQLAQQMRELEAARALARKRAAEAGAIGAVPVGKKTVQSSWAQELRGAANLRRAVVWREVLGPPVGLR